MHELAWYADSNNFNVWKVTTTKESRERRLRAWLKAGANHKPRPLLPPLDQPAEMAAWWDRVIGNKCPPAIIALARAAYGGGTPPPNPIDTPSPATATPAPQPQVMLDLKTIAPGTALERLDGLRRAVAGAEQLYFDALAKGNSDVDYRREAYEKLFDALRKAEKDTEQLREARGELIPRDALKVELQRIHTAIASCFRQAVATLSCPAEEKDRCLVEAFRPLRDAAFGIDQTAPATAA